MTESFSPVVYIMRDLPFAGQRLVERFRVGTFARMKQDWRYAEQERLESVAAKDRDVPLWIE